MEKRAPPASRFCATISAAVRFDQLTRDRKSQAETARARARTTIEFFEYFVLFARGKTGALIGNGNNKHRIIARRADIDRAMHCRAHRIRQQRPNAC